MMVIGEVGVTVVICVKFVTDIACHKILKLAIQLHCHSFLGHDGLKVYSVAPFFIASFVVEQCTRMWNNISQFAD